MNKLAKIITGAALGIVLLAAPAASAFAASAPSDTPGTSRPDANYWQPEATENVKSVDATVAANGTVTMHVGEEYAGRVITVYLNSTPVFVGTYAVDAKGNVTISGDAIAAVKAAKGTHTLAAYDGSELIGTTSIVLNEDGSVNVEATKAAIEALKATAAGTNPFIPAGIAAVIVLGAIAVARRRSVTQK